MIALLVAHLIGEDGRLDVVGLPVEIALLRLLEEAGLLEDMNGFVVSACLYFLPEARLTEFRPAMRDGVNGAFASDRERRCIGVLGACAIEEETIKGLYTKRTSYARKGCRGEGRKDNEKARELEHAPRDRSPRVKAWESRPCPGMVGVG